MNAVSAILEPQDLPLLAAPRAPLIRPAGHGATVSAYTQGMRGFSSQHEQLTRMEVVRRLALLKGYRAVDEAAVRRAGPGYLVPSDTLVGTAHAAALGVRGRDDLFGGVVPHAFVATKAISHPLLRPDSAAPAGWRHDFHAAIATAVLRGYTAFDLEDAREAGYRLLRQDRVRVKQVHETGGRGQVVVRNMRELEACLEALDAQNVGHHGLVLEQDLSPVQTFSVGQVHVAGITASYVGRQHLTRNNKGHEVYGGTELMLVRGDFVQLLASGLPPALHLAVEQTLVVDTAVAHFFPGFFASRINYDLVQGRDASGAERSGVLEQSWRIGGASGAEIAGLEALTADPERNSVHTRCVEAYGADAVIPPGASVYFQGVDDRLGPMAKYAVVLPDGHAA